MCVRWWWWGGLVKQKQNDNEGRERGEHRRHGESQPGEQALGRGGGGRWGVEHDGRRGGWWWWGVCVDPTPYVWMSDGKLLMGLIMDDTIRGHRGGGRGV